MSAVVSREGARDDACNTIRSIWFAAASGGGCWSRLSKSFETEVGAREGQKENNRNPEEKIILPLRTGFSNRRQRNGAGWPVVFVVVGRCVGEVFSFRRPTHSPAVRDYRPSDRTDCAVFGKVAKERPTKRERELWETHHGLT